MIQIPGENLAYTQPNNSDLFGSLWYTRNISLDEAGYLKLSSRAVSIASEKTDNNVGTVMSFGRSGFSGGTLTFYAVTSDKPLIITLSSTSLSVVSDTETGSPQFTFDSAGRWFHNLWIVTDANDFFSKDPTSGTYTDRGNLTADVAHPIEVFRNKDRICFGDGNTVKMYSESGGTFTLDKTLVLPADFEVIGLAYSNYQMGIIANLSDTVPGQNQDAYFFTWDGSTTEAGAGVPVNSDKTIAFCAYKGTWALLTRAGELIGYTGGGFSDLSKLPFYAKGISWGDLSTSRDNYGDSMVVSGSRIYMNINGFLGAYGNKFEQYLQNNPGGIWCYEPTIGLTHRYSPSISPASVLTVTQANINTTTNVMTKTAGTIPSTGSPVKYLNQGNLIGGIMSPIVYYCIKLSSTTFSLANTRQEAIDGTAIDLTSQGDTNNYFLAPEQYDFGQSYQNTVSGFENRGVSVSPKIPSSAIEDTLQKSYTSFRPLGDDDKLIVKTKSKELLGLPISTPQARSSTKNQCFWTSPDEFYTGADLSDAKNALDDGIELECEVIAGAGAGTLVRITGITYESGLYSVTLEEEVLGAGSGRRCDVLIDNWDTVGVITNDDKKYKETAVGTQSNWHKVKVELRGSGTTLEKNQLINDPYGLDI